MPSLERLPDATRVSVKQRTSLVGDPDAVQTESTESIMPDAYAMERRALLAELALARATQRQGDEKPAQPNNPLNSPGFDAAALASNLKAGETVTFTAKDGNMQVTKAGPSTYNNWFQAPAAFASAGFSGLFNTLDSAVGTDPTLSALTGFQTMFTTFSNMPLIAGGITMFSDKFMPAFRLFAPVLDTLKLANTVKTSQAKVKIALLRAAKEAKAAAAQGLPAAPPAPTPTGWLSKIKSTLLSHLKNGSLVDITIDAAHLGLNLLCAASVLGALIHLPLIVLMSMPVAIGVGLAGDICAGVYHTAGTGLSINDPHLGASYGERFSRFVTTQAGSAMLRRVFGGQEPLMGVPDEIDPNKGPVQSPNGDNAVPPAPPAADPNKSNPGPEQPQTVAV